MDEFSDIFFFVLRHLNVKSENRVAYYNKKLVSVSGFHRNIICIIFVVYVPTLKIICYTIQGLIFTGLILREEPILRISWINSRKWPIFVDFIVIIIFMWGTNFKSRVHIVLLS